MTNPENSFFTTQGVLKFLLGEGCGITHENNNNFHTMAKVVPEEHGMEFSNTHMWP